MKQNLYPFVDMDTMTLAKLQQFILYGNQFIEHINCDSLCIMYNN